MLRRTILQITALSWALAAWPVQAVEVGQTAPAFELPSANAGKPVRQADYAGHTVYLDFWASWCGPCRKSFPWMNSMQARYRAQGLRVVAVNVDQKQADALAFLKEVPAQFDVAFDPAGHTPRAYGIKGMPSSVLIGADGRVLAQHAGFSPERAAELEQSIQQALKHKP